MGMITNMYTLILDITSRQQICRLLSDVRSSENSRLLWKEESTTYLKEALKGTEDKLILPEACANSKPSWFGFLITCKEGVDRNKLVQEIESRGVQTRMLFAGNLTKHPCFDQMRASGKGYRIAGSLENTDRIMKDTFWIGVYPGMTDEMLQAMADAIKDALN